MNRTSSTARTEKRGGKTSHTPHDHYQEVTDRIVAALEAGTPPWRRPWDPDKAGGTAMPRNATTGQRYRGINVLTLGMSVLAFSSGDPRWATYKQAEDRGWQVRKGERGTTGYFFKRLARGSCPTTWCRNCAPEQRWLRCQTAMAGRLTRGSSLSGAMVSSVIYRAR